MINNAKYPILGIVLMANILSFVPHSCVRLYQLPTVRTNNFYCIGKAISYGNSLVKSYLIVKHKYNLMAGFSRAEKVETAVLHLSIPLSLGKAFLHKLVQIPDKDVHIL